MINFRSQTTAKELSMNNSSPNNQGRSEFNSAENRYFPRWDVEDKIEYFLDSTTHAYHGLTKNLSCNGACLWLSDDLYINEKISLRIHLSEDDIARVHSRVSWVVKMPDGSNVAGVKFYDVTTRAQELILKHAFTVKKDQFIQNFFSGWNNTK